MDRKDAFKGTAHEALPILDPRGYPGETAFNRIKNSDAMKITMALGMAAISAPFIVAEYVRDRLNQ